jgi:hypothetical protein
LYQIAPGIVLAKALFGFTGIDQDLFQLIKIYIN